MAKLARFSCSSKPLARPATIMIGISAVLRFFLTAVINSAPDIFGICMSVTIRSGRRRSRICSASRPLVADSTAKPRSSRKRQTVYRISMESSTTNATPGMSLQRAECTPPARTLAEPVCQEQGETRHAGYYGDHRLCFCAFSRSVLGSWLTKRGLRFLGFAFGVFLDAHVFEFARLEDFAALEALHELSVFLAADDLHARMLARFLARVLRMRERL